mmetsp:Transcript_64807/g.186441  ORF Transcript_64807/g.186441 Transcript_64807/m.186441 type:complete len:232 (-) Transcript_64807:75-770(-)
MLRTPPLWPKKIHFCRNFNTSTIATSSCPLKPPPKSTMVIGTRASFSALSLSNSRLFWRRSATFFFGSRASCSFLRARRMASSFRLRSASRSTRSFSAWPPSDMCSKRRLFSKSPNCRCTASMSRSKTSGRTRPKSSAVAARRSASRPCPPGLATRALPAAVRSICTPYRSFLKFSRLRTLERPMSWRSGDPDRRLQLLASKRLGRSSSARSKSWSSRRSKDCLARDCCSG